MPLKTDVRVRREQHPLKRCTPILTVRLRVPRDVKQIVRREHVPRHTLDDLRVRRHDLTAEHALRILGFVVLIFGTASVVIHKRQDGFPTDHLQRDRFVRVVAANVQRTSIKFDHVLQPLREPRTERQPLIRHIEEPDSRLDVFGHVRLDARNRLPVIRQRTHVVDQVLRADHRNVVGFPDRLDRVEADPVPPRRYLDVLANRVVPCAWWPAITPVRIQRPAGRERWTPRHALLGECQLKLFGCACESGCKVLRDSGLQRTAQTAATRTRLGGEHRRRATHPGVPHQRGVTTQEALLGNPGPLHRLFDRADSLLHRLILDALTVRLTTAGQDRDVHRRLTAVV